VVHSIQIEVNRDLYMNEEEVTIKEEGMRGLQATVAHLTRVLLERAEEQGTIQGA
jgi:N-formylglutamate amidohydrolase